MLSGNLQPEFLPGVAAKKMAMKGDVLYVSSSNILDHLQLQVLGFPSLPFTFE